MATTPSPALIGVDRVLIKCEPDSSLSLAERRTLCEQLVKKAQSVTDLPVAVATADDLSPANLAAQADQLLLRVLVSATSAEQGRKSLAITVTPVRAARPQGQMAALKSSATLVNVQNDWVVQGPVDAFTKLLGGSKKLRTPVRSDS